MDKLKLASEKSIVKQFEANETIEYSGTLYKFNDEGKRQQRSLLITTHSIYNLSKVTVKRKIALSKISAITLSTLGMEFIIHVPEEYDYRYASTDDRDVIIQNILKNARKQVVLYFKEEITLTAYLTMKSDKKKGVSRIPNTGGVVLSEQEFRQRCQSDTEERLQLKARTSTLYGKTKVSIDDFTLVKVLGRGAYGKVMLVEKKDTHELFAMKSIRKEDISDQETLEHTKTERLVLEHANHPFLVGLAFSFQTPEKIFFVTEFMRGGELFQHLKKVKRFEEKRARFYCAEIVLAFEHLHSKRIIYRDLKPENVLMDDNGHICLTDFGMAKILRKNELAMTFCGTPEYLAPEILQEVGHSMAADWWALGIFTYEMMFALPPFYSKNQDMMFKHIQKSDVMFPQQPAISNEGKDFIQKVGNVLLIKDPVARMGTKQGAEEIKQHAWFKGIDWGALLQKKVETPYKPPIQGDEWIGNFDQEFTNEQPINSYTENSDLINQEEFKGFEYAK